MKAIETYYNGYRFRSRLEARWAVFFDALNVEYDYEPEGYTKNDVTYLPDFRVPCYGYRGYIGEGDPTYLYIEVKGQMTEEDARKIKTFSAQSLSGNDYNALMTGDKKIEELNCIPILIVDKIPEENDSPVPTYRDMGYNCWTFNYQSIDGDFFGAYPAADEYGRFYLWGDDGSYIIQKDYERVRQAYQIARQARFEHGEKPFFNKH